MSGSSTAISVSEGSRAMDADDVSLDVHPAARIIPASARSAAYFFIGKPPLFFINNTGHMPERLQK